MDGYTIDFSGSCNGYKEFLCASHYSGRCLFVLKVTTFMSKYDGNEVEKD